MFTLEEMKSWKNPDEDTVTCTIVAFCKNHPGSPFKVGEFGLFLGNIPGMKGHCAISDGIGRVHWALHNYDFKVVPEDLL